MAAYTAASLAAAPHAPDAARETADAVSLLLEFGAALRGRSPAFAALQQEKSAGWTSAAVDLMWREKDRQFAGQVHRKDAQKKQAGNRVPSTTKYVRFYRQWMPELQPALFCRRSGSPMGGDDPSAPTFCDMGSSPGGMCEYLVGDLGFRGHAFSLACDEEGFGMAFAHRDLLYKDNDTAADGAWRAMLASVGGGTCDFVNCGIVVDRGQKANSDDARRAAKTSGSAAEMAEEDLN
eukprot:7085714-Prymnesium_polylepis.1